MHIYLYQKIQNPSIFFFFQLNYTRIEHYTTVNKNIKKKTPFLLYMNSDNKTIHIQKYFPQNLMSQGLQLM